MTENRKTMPLFFAVGFIAQTAQVLLIREVFLNFQGNELAFGVVFSIWLLFLAFGTLVASLVRYRPSIMLVSIFTALLAYLPFCIHLLRVWKVWTSLPSGQVIPLFSAVVYTTMIAGPLIFLCGALFSVALRYNEEKHLISPARLYILDALGDLAAGVLFSFVFVLFLDHFQVIVLTAFVCVLSFVLRETGTRRAFALLFLFALCVAVMFIPRLERLSEEVRFRAINLQLRLADIRHSPYGEVAVTQIENSEQLDFFINGNYYFSIPDPYGIAVQAHSLLALHPEPKKLLLLGGTPIISEALSHPLEQIDCVELDPTVVSMLLNHSKGREQVALNDPRIRLNFADARAFVTVAPESEYDIVASYAGEPLTFSLNRLFTEQFFEEVKRVLRPNGVFVLSLTVSPDAQIEMIQRTLCIISTLKKVFKNVRCTPAHLTIASDSPLETDPAVLAERYINRSVKSDYFDPALYATLFQPSEQERIDSALERFSKETEVSINTDENPNAVVKSLKLWRLLSTDEDRVFYDAIESIKLEHIAVIAGVLFALGSVLRIFRRDITFSYSVYLTVFACGFFGMAVSITLLVLLQSTVGIAYSLVSALSGVFMFGLAAGAEITLKHNFNSKRVLIILILISIALTFSLLSILPLSSLIRSRTFSAVLFMILSLLSGAIVGAVYRVALALCKDMPKSAARIYSVDLFGATFGSISIGCAILLTSGILISTVSVSLVLFSALLCLLTAPHRP